MSDAIHDDFHRDVSHPYHRETGFDEGSGPKGASERRTTTRADLLDAVYATCPSLSRSQAREIFEMALSEVTDALTRGETVKLRSFGLLTVREKRERIGRNPRTGVEVPIKPRRVLTFKPSPVLLDHVNGRDPGKGERAGED